LTREKTLDLNIDFPVSVLKNFSAITVDYKLPDPLELQWLPTLAEINLATKSIFLFLVKNYLALEFTLNTAIYEIV
jgi:hypothetical protein